MAVKFAAGQYANLLERALSVTMSPAAAAAYPAANLWDGRPERPAEHGSNSANPTITADLAAFTPSGPGTYLVTARAGERRRLVSVGATSITLQNLSTGKYLTTASAWQVASTPCLTGAGSRDYQVESLTLCQVPIVVLKIVVTNGTSVTDWPAWNAIVVFGHNLAAGLSIAARSSTDNFGASDVLEASGAIRRPSFLLAAAAPSYNRYARLAITGTNQVAPWYAEVILCYLETGVTTLGMDHDVQQEEAQIRHDGPLGSSYVYLLAEEPRRVAKWAFNMDVPREVEIREEVVLRSRGGAYPLVLVPTSSDAAPLVLFGSLDSKWRSVRNFLDIWSTDLVLSEGHIVAPLA